MRWQMQSVDTNLCSDFGLLLFLYVNAKHVVCIKSFNVIFTTSIKSKNASEKKAEDESWFKKLKQNLIHPTGDGGWDVSFGGHTATIGRTEMPGYVSLHRGSFLLAARERGEETADCVAEGNYLRAAGGAEKPPAPHQSPGATGEISIWT